MATTAVDWEAIAGQVDQAAKELRASKGIPAAVGTVLDDLLNRLHADSPQVVGADPYLTARLFAGLARAEKALRHEEAASARTDVRLALEQVRQAVRDIVANRPVDDATPIGQVLTATVGMTAASQADLASLYGTSTRTIQRWLSGDATPNARDAARVRIVAQLVNQLRYVFTGPGVLVWLTRPSPSLGQAPVECLDDPERYPELMAAATATRAMAG